MYSAGVGSQRQPFANHVQVVVLDGKEDMAIVNYFVSLKTLIYKGI